MDAAVVKLDALANAVGTGREDNHTGLLGLSALGCATVLVGEVVVARAGSKLAGAGVDSLHERAHANDLAHGTHNLLARPREVGNLTVREAKLLGGQHVVVVQANEPQLRDRAFGGDDVRDAVKEPAVDVRELEDALHAPATTQSLGHIEDALRGGRGHTLLEGLLVTVVVAVGAQACVSLLERAHGLLQRLLEGGANGHDLAHGLHARGERGVRTLELLESKARNLYHTVVNRGLEAGRRGLRDVVGDLVQSVANGEKRRLLGNGEAGGLGCKGRGAAHARVHLDDDHAAVVGVHGKLHVGAAAGNAHALEVDRVVAQALELEVVERLAGRHGDGIAGVHAHGVEVLEGAHHDAVAGGVAHDLHLDLFPALEALLDENLGVGRERQALAGNTHQVIVGVCHAAAGTAQRVGGTNHHGVANVFGCALALFERVRGL